MILSLQRIYIRQENFIFRRAYLNGGGLPLLVFQGRSIFLTNEKPPNLKRRGGGAMVTWIELIALLTLITAVIELVIKCNDNKKN